MKLTSLLLILPIILFISGCESTKISEDCIKACNEAVSSGKELESGPCLFDSMPINTDWVCDVAHNPRQQTDNLAENQCQSYREGKAKHFVEVTPDCKIIKTI